MHHADQARRLGVYANADTGPDCARARRFGARGVGLVRTEHMFLGERRQLVEDLILADTAEERQRALDALEPLQRGDFVEILDAMDGLPVTIRLIDPPLHEFLPDLTDLSVKIALDGDNATDKDKALLAAVRRLHEQNPMLGLRGVRLGLVIPGLFDMQVRAIAHAAAELKQAGQDPRPEVMIPLTATVQEMEISREHAEKVLEAVEAETGTHVHTMIGTMIEVPRAALNAGPIAASAEFFSFGTNDLTQMTWGFSRDDVEGAFFSRYIELGIFGVSPFETIDTEGIGRMIRMASEEGRAARPDLELGVCGEHGGDPESVHFFHEVGLNYVSCSPFRHNGEVALAGLAAGCGGFEGNAQSLRLLSRLEAKVAGAGLNLTRATLDGCVKYPWGAPEPQAAAGPPAKFGYYADDAAAYRWIKEQAPDGKLCLEAQVMDWADDVAYSVHDLEDGLQAGHITLRALRGAAERAAVTELATRYSPQGTTGAELDEVWDGLLGL